MGTLPSNLIDDAAMTIADGINTGEIAFKDGFQFLDIFKFITQILSIQVIVEQKEELLAQLKDYDLSERGVTIQKIQDKLTWEKPDAEALVGIIYDIIFALVRGVVFLSERNQA